MQGYEHIYLNMIIMVLLAGIDPGLSGAIAFMDDVNIIIYPMPIIKTKIKNKFKSDLDMDKICIIFKNHHPDVCYVEKVHSMSKQGVSSTFLFGKNYGMVLGILQAYDIFRTDVTPQKWKKYFGLTADKNDSLIKATELFPAYQHYWKLKKNNGLAEAILIAEYGKRTSK